jgi:hypothetical protein
MKTIYSIIIVLLTLSSISCEKELKLDEELTNPKIVVNSLYSANDTLKVHLSESRSVLQDDYKPLPNIENATVNLFSNGTEVGTLTHQSDGNYILNSPFPVAGQSYELEVKHPTLDDVTSESTCPSLIQITSIDTSRIQNDFKLAITIQDDPAETNYYSIRIMNTFTTEYESSPGVFQIDTITYPAWICTKDINSETNADPLGEICQDELFFNDINFNGSTHQFNVSVDIYQGEKLTVYIKSINESLFKYNKSFQLYQENNGNPFGEPVQVYSNIENGIGIFSGYSETIKIIEL